MDKYRSYVGMDVHARSITLASLDTETGVLYLQVSSGYAGGLTPLLDGEGKPMQWSRG